MDEIIPVHGVRTVFLHSVNTGTGGGMTLLNQLVLDLEESGYEVIAQIDSRNTFGTKDFNSVSIKYVSPNIFSRLFSEIHLKRRAEKYDLVLCFGSLPPLFSVQGNVAIFIQNRYLIDKVSLKNFSLKNRIKIACERLWLRYRSKENYRYIAQTSTMRKLFAKNFPVHTNSISVQSLYGGIKYNNEGRRDIEYDFVYIASGEPHKNHRNLIEAWIILANNGLYPSLCLTIDGKSFPALYTDISESIAKHRLKIFNLGWISESRVNDCYASSSALIFPSLFESFGLPLVEASYMGLPILAPERDYVRDVVRPIETFDPSSPVSISRAITRFLEVPDDPIEFVTGKSFIKNTFNLFGM